MIRKILETNELSFEINILTRELEVRSSLETFTIPSDDAIDLLIELRKQQLDYLQKKQDQDKDSIMKLFKGI